MPPGRKPKYRTAKEMSEAIERYFEECDSYTYLLDKSGNPVLYKGVPTYDKKPEPYTEHGLALFLGFSKLDNLKRYIGKDEIPKEDEYDNFLSESYNHVTFRKVINDALLRINTYREKALYDKNTVTGAKFALETRGWGGKKEIDLNVKAVGALVTEEEAMKRLKELGFEETK